MSVQLFAQPYDISASGFYFDSAEEFHTKALALQNDYGDPVEEFELQFIDGDGIDYAFAKAFGINQANYVDFFAYAEDWEEWEKVIFIIAVGECGYQFDPSTVTPDDFDVDVYDVENMRELAEQFVEEGLFGDIPENLQHYIDFDAIARDLAVDYGETVIDGGNVVYRCG